MFCLHQNLKSPLMLKVVLLVQTPRPDSCIRLRTPPLKQPRYAGNDNDGHELLSHDHSFRSFPSFFPHTYRAHVTHMVKDAAVTAEQRGARREPAVKGIHTARYVVQLLVLLAVAENFVVQDFFSLRPLPTRAAAEPVGLTTARPTPLSPRRRVRRSCALAGLKRHCGLRYYPRCSSASLR
jgi:hypothetical protein